MDKKLFHTICFLIFFLISCSNKKTLISHADKISEYESRARTYQALADAQRLSPPYTSSIPGRQIGIHNPRMRMTYLLEARRYRKLADQLKKESNLKKE